MKMQLSSFLQVKKNTSAQARIGTGAGKGESRLDSQNRSFRGGRLRWNMGIGGSDKLGIVLSQVDHLGDWQDGQNILRMFRNRKTRTVEIGVAVSNCRLAAG